MLEMLNFSDYFTSIIAIIAQVYNFRYVAIILYIVLGNKMELSIFKSM